jgi:cytochrome c-type biogenesis protein CcmH
MKKDCVPFFLLAAALAAGAVSASAGDNDARYSALISELRCLVCQNQTIAESNAPLAADLRAQVKSQMDAGRTDAEIVDYLTARYGDFVLYRPPFRMRTWLLWLGPFAVLLVAGAVATVFVRRSRRSLPPAPVGADEVRRVVDRQMQDDGP